MKHGPVQRETKEVLAELVGELRGKLDRKASSGSAGEHCLRCGLRPNLDRLTVGVDLGDQWSQYCILGLEKETLSEGQVRTTQADLAGLFEALTPARVVMEVGTHPAWVQEVIAGCGHEVLVANPRGLSGLTILLLLADLRSGLRDATFYEISLNLELLLRA